ncbi:hypothetical protein HDU78_000786 [Chytriomyces hyalinus]|nr:hypothetical protein HDU78_000786 [Chytriomyces hyalinus]
MNTHTDEHNHWMDQYRDQPGFYIARVTQSDPLAKRGEIVKFGHTTIALGGRVKSHVKDFKTFNLVLFVPSTHSVYIERIFKQLPLVSQNRVTGGYQSRGHNHSEILELTEDFNMDHLRRIVNGITQLLAIAPGAVLVEEQPGIEAAEVVEDEVDNLPRMWLRTFTEASEKAGLHFSEMFELYKPWHLQETGQICTTTVNNFSSAIVGDGKVWKRAAFRLPNTNPNTGIKNRRLIQPTLQ